MWSSTKAYMQQVHASKLITASYSSMFRCVWTHCQKQMFILNKQVGLYSIKRPMDANDNVTNYFLEWLHQVLSTLQLTFFSTTCFHVCTTVVIQLADG
jgi:hypothetical protein